MKNFVPEGKLFNSSANKYYLQSEAAMREAFEQGITLEGHAVRCTPEHDLQVELPFGVGIIPRCEGAIGIEEGVTRDIALLSRVNKTVCFKVMEIRRSGEGTVCVLSRRQAQIECMNEYISKLCCGDVIPAKVTHLEPFGCFADIGCGIVSLIPIDAISVSRISHPGDRFFNGQDIFAVVKDISGGRITLSHKELLGTWEQNAALFSAGETVGGMAEPQDNVREGQAASVYIKALIPEKMKVKLIIVDVFDSPSFPAKNNYFITSGRIKSWVYSTPDAQKLISTEFA